MISHTQYDKCYSRNLWFFPWEVMYLFMFAFLPADRRGLYSLSQRPWGTLIPFMPFIHDRYFSYLQWLLCVYTFTFQLRCWVALVRFHSSFCPSSVATGSRGPIISLQSPQKLTSHLVLPPISNWRQTAQLKYTGSNSWGRWEEMQNNLVQMPKKAKKPSQTFGCSAERALLRQKLQMSSVLLNTNELEFIVFALHFILINLFVLFHIHVWGRAWRPPSFRFPF